MGFRLGFGGDCGCCDGGACDVKSAGSGGAGTTVKTHKFPATQENIEIEWQMYSVPDELIVSTPDDSVIYFETGGQVSGTGKKCFTKPAGETDIKVTVKGPYGTAWRYSIKCGCNQPPPPEKMDCCGDLSLICITNIPPYMGAPQPGLTPGGGPVEFWGSKCDAHNMDCCVRDRGGEGNCGRNPINYSPCLEKGKPWPGGLTRPPLTDEDLVELPSTAPFDCYSGGGLSAIKVKVDGFKWTTYRDALANSHGGTVEAQYSYIDFWEQWINDNCEFALTICTHEQGVAFPEMDAEWQEPVTFDPDTGGQVTFGNKYPIKITPIAWVDLHNRSARVTLRVTFTAARPYYVITTNEDFMLYTGPYPGEIRPNKISYCPAGYKNWPTLGQHRSEMLDCGTFALPHGEPKQFEAMISVTKA